MTIEPISDERLAEIRAGLEECTGGEWTAGCLARHEDGCQCAYIFGGDYMGGIGTVYIDNGIRGLAEGQNDCPPKDEARANLLHIARCSPATILSLLSRLDKAEAGCVPDGMVLVPVKPTDALLRSMAIRYDHGLGCPGYYDQPIFGAENVGHDRRLESTMTTMRQLHEEVVGTGFYRFPPPPSES